MMERYVQNKEIVQSKIGEEVVMLDMESGSYFGLNAVASAIWEKLEHAVDFKELVESLLTQFDVDQTECEADTKELLEQMLANNIIRRAK